MIVVISQAEHPSGVAIARAAAAAGGKVELVAKVPDDPAGDRLLRGLAAAGIGHVATLRQPPSAATAALDAADLDLALRYLTDATTIVVTSPSDDRSLQVAIDAAGWGHGTLIVVVRDGRALGPLPDGAIVFEAPSAEPDGAFAAVVGTLAARVDGGMDPATAFTEAMASGPSWTPVADGD